MSATSHNTAALQQRLASLEPDPAGMYDLMVHHYRDPDAVEVLCGHAEGSVPLQVAVYVGLKYCTVLQAVELLNKRASKKAWNSATRFEAQVESSVGAQFAHATEADLLEGFRTARSGLPDGSPAMLEWVSHLFAAHSPLEALTDRVTAEMTWRLMKEFCPELGAGPLPSPESPLAAEEDGRIRWLMSRYLYNRFGHHGPSWGVSHHP